jgi:flagellar biosynthesis GTPase FlhF
MDSTLSEDTPETACSERRLAANRANAQLSTGPRTEVGKAISSLNAVKTGLCGRALLLADDEEAEAYRAHVARVRAWWAPANIEEHALVQSLADTQWRLESIPGLESALYARARLRGEPLLTHPDPTVGRLLLNAQAEVAEARALKNLRLHERRLRRQFEQDKAELNQLRKERFEQEAHKRQAEAQRQQEEAEQERRREQAHKRAARRKGHKEADALAAQPERTAEPEITPNGFEFATSGQTDLTPFTVHNKER